MNFMLAALDQRFFHGGRGFRWYSQGFSEYIYIYKWKTVLRRASAFNSSFAGPDEHIMTAEAATSALFY